MELISMVDFVLDGQETADYIKLYNGCFEYAKFLKQHLELGFFVPCDLDGNVLEEPDFMSGDYDNNGFGDVDKYKYKKDLKEYQEAKESVLFEGFKLSITKDAIIFVNCIIRIHRDNNFSCAGKQVRTIEDLIKFNLVLTESAKKQIGL